MKYLLIIIILSSLSVNAQQEPPFSMFWNNYSLFNPANSGLDKSHYANLTYRNDWVKLENSPKVITALYDAKIDKYNSGIGAGFLFKTSGLHMSNRFYINYNYQFKINKSLLRLGVGVDYDIMQYKNNWLPPSGPGPIDPLLPDGNKQGKLNLNFGTVFKRERLKLGVSVTQLNEAYYEKLSYKKVKHIFIFAQYRFRIVEKFEIIPTFYAKSDFQFNTIELNTRFIYDKKYWLGFSYRSNDAISFQAGFSVLEKFKLAYNFDYMTSHLVNYSGGSHEISLGFVID